MAGILIAEVPGLTQTPFFTLARQAFGFAAKSREFFFQIAALDQAGLT
ncbi:MAG: hypothetical protein WCK35_15710 [Chloroflexota bacterium]